ncbi:MAG: membrane anchored protein in chemotaxis locus [Shewanella sp.]
MSTNSVLIMLLMGIAILVLGALSLDYRRKNSLLQAEIKRLESSQVLLMVPDEQAEAIATWLSSHPDQTSAMLQLASPGERKAVEIGPNVPLNAPPLLDKQSVVGDNDTTKQHAEGVNPASMLTEPKNAAILPVVVSENADGVKVISLPNGGIRVTTRKE